MKQLAFLAAVLALSACGGSNAPHPAPPVQAPPPPPVAAADPFVVQLSQLVAAQPEDTEPSSLDASAPGMPEETEPGAVGP